MTTIQQTYDTLGQGVTPTTSNLSGGGSNPSLVSIAAGDTITGDGGRLKFTFAGPGAGATRVMYACNDTGRVVASTLFEYGGPTGVVEDIGGFRSSAANVCDLHIGTDNKLIMYNKAGTGLAGQTGQPDSRSSVTLAAGDVVRVDWSAKMGTTTTDGTLGYAVFLNGATTPAFSWESSVVDAGTAAITSAWVGRGTGRASARTVWHDFTRVQTQASGWLSAPPATSTVSLSLNTISGKLRPGTSQTVTATVTDTSGVVASLDYVQTSGPAVTFTGSGTSRTYKTPPVLTDTVLTFRVAAKNSAGTELAFSTVSHTVAASKVRFTLRGDVLPLAVALNGSVYDVVLPSGLTVPPVVVDPGNTRPTGANYVAIESLGNGQFVGNPNGAMQAYSGNGKILTHPAGVILSHNWNAGNSAAALNIENGWRGFVGNGALSSGAKATIFRFAPDMVKVTPPTTGTNPYRTIKGGITSRKILELGNFHMDGNAGHAHGGIQLRADLNASSETVHVWNLSGDDAAPGYSNSPPGETFFLDLWHTNASLVEDISVEGRKNSSSAVGYNDAHNTVTKRVYANECIWGMPTWWQSDNIYTEDITSLGGYCGINMENVGGTIEHHRLTLKPDRARRASAMHSTLQSNQTRHVASRVEFHDMTLDTGLKGGCFMLLSSKNYPVAGGDSAGGNTQLQVPSRVYVYRNGVPLTMQDTALPGNASPDPAKYWYLYR